MRNLKSYINPAVVSVMLPVLMASVTSCNDFTTDAPAFNVPTATIQPNTTIKEVKTKYWDDATNYIDQVKLTDGGEHVVVSGRVISSDRAGNIYKSLYIQDATGGLVLSINKNSLYNEYRMGQEVVIDLTDMYIGKYNGLQQMGFPEWYAAGNAWEATFMPYEFFAEHSQLNGLPELDKINIATVSDFSVLGTQPTSAQKIEWQGRIVRLQNVHFKEDEQGLNFTDGYKINTNRTLCDASGNEITVRTSGYANFRNVPLPKGNFDFVGLLGFYGDSWQVMLNDTSGLEGVTYEKGTVMNPYTVEEALNIENASGYDNSVIGWTEGYIVGCLAPEVSTVTKTDDIAWDGTDYLGTTLVIAPTADTKDINNCLIFNLPQGSELQTKANLMNNPGNLGKLMKIRGTLMPEYGIGGIGNISGDMDSFWIEGMDEPVGPDQPVTGGDGTEASPYSCAQVIALNPPSKDTPLETGKWVKGYIVGVYNFDNTASQFEFTGTVTVNSNILIADSPSETSDAKIVTIKLSPGNIRDAVNLVSNPGNYKKEVMIYGDVQKYCGKPGMQNVTNYKLDGQSGGDQPTPPSGQITGAGTEADPFTADDVIIMNPQSKDTPAAGQSNVWVKGYIVGYYDFDNTANQWQFSGTSTITTNILIASSASETSADKIVAVKLSAGDIRNALNLSQNPGNYKKEVLLCGDILKYCGKPGVANLSAYKLDGQGGGGDQPTPPSSELTGKGTEAEPFTVGDIRILNPQVTSGPAEGQAGVWVEGYIVGYYNNFACFFTAENAPYANVLLAPTADCTDESKVIDVQLVSKTDPRTALNLGDNPDMLGAHVMVKGDVLKYNSLPGIKNTSDYKKL